MKKMLISAFMLISLGVASESDEPKLCYDILKEIETLKKYKKQEEQGNFEWAERIALASVGKGYFADRRKDGRHVSIEEEINMLNSKLPTCRKY